MPVISIRIPQLGEGLQEALLVEFLKNPGDEIKRDDPIYVMETDKATTDVESPYSGTLVEWTVETGSVLEIGAEIGKMEVAEGVKEMPAGHGPAEDSAPAVSDTATATATARETKSAAVRSGSVQIPPRTRKYLKEKGLLDVADKIPASGKKLMPDDVDAYLAAQGGVSAVESDKYDVSTLPKNQITLNYRLQRGSQLCVPVTIMNEVDWSRLDDARNKVRESGGPTAFAMSLWCIVQSLKKFDRFRSSLGTDGKTLKTFKEVNLGVAVSLPGDQLVTAVVPGACQLDKDAFFASLGAQIEKARDGQDQVDESTTVSVSNIGKAGMKIGIPAIVAPAMATLAVGQTYWQPHPDDGGGFSFSKTATLTLSFDHRVANGVGAANFLADVKNEIENFSI